MANSGVAKRGVAKIVVVKMGVVKKGVVKKGGADVSCRGLAWRCKASKALIFMGVILRRAWKALAYLHLDLKGVACEGLVCKGVASDGDLACKGMAKEGKHA